MTIKDTLSTPSPAETKALELHGYLAADPIIEEMLLSADDGGAILLWSEAELTRLRALLSSQNGVIAVLPPSIFTEAQSDRQAVQINVARIPVYVMLAKMEDMEQYMTLLNRMVELVQSRMALQAVNPYIGDEVPYLESVEPLGIKELGDVMDNYVSTMLFYRVRYVARYTPNP